MRVHLGTCVILQRAVIQATKSMDKSAPKSAPKKLHNLEYILNEFKTLDQVQFDAFKPEAHTKAQANFLSLFYHYHSHIHSTTLICSLQMIFGRQLPRIRINTLLSNIVQILKSVADHGKTLYQKRCMYL
jgi:hypothetical protein